MEEKPKWEIKSHFHQIGDSGDYDGCYEITDGKVSFYTKDQWDDETMEKAVEALNNTDCDFYMDDSSEFVIFMLQKENDDLVKEVKRLEGLLEQAHQQDTNDALYKNPTDNTKCEAGKDGSCNICNLPF